MSKKSNVQRAATAFHDCTGSSYLHGLDLAERGDIRTGFAVPDAATAEQRRSEARFVRFVAEIVKDKQVGSALLGVIRVVPTPTSITLSLQPQMQRYLVRELLPGLDEYGSVRGWPGLRCATEGGRLILLDGSSAARIFISSWDSAPPQWTPDADETAVPAGSLHPAEVRAIAKWSEPAWRRSDHASRDLLFSRLLRRACLLNAAGAAHGLANAYSHHNYDLVIEYCCGPTAPALVAALHASGLDYNAPSGTRTPDPGYYVALGDAEIQLRRRARCCLDSGYGTDYVQALRTRTPDNYPDVTKDLAAMRGRREQSPDWSYLSYMVGTMDEL